MIDSNVVDFRTILRFRQSSKISYALSQLPYSASYTMLNSKEEIDKIVKTYERGGDVSREGVQRDLLPLIEGTVVQTKHGAVKTDHILFITSGAFHMAKPSDLLPELQ